LKEQLDGQIKQRIITHFLSILKFSLANQGFLLHGAISFQLNFI